MRDHIQVYADGARIFDVHDSTWASGRLMIRTTTSGSDIDVDDVLVTRFGTTGCYVGANDRITYTLPISNQGRLSGYDLVVTDRLPSGLSLVTYTLTSNDSSNPAVTSGPSVGATGDLIWHIDHLTPTSPFATLSHTALTLTVVLQVSDAITAHIILPNQAALSYDAWPGSGQPTPIFRQYSGGSHSTAVRTVNGGLRKEVQFSPPPTATLGTLVTYTIIAPADQITATLYDVVVTDTVDARQSIESVAASGGVNPSVTWSGQTVTATFDSIPHDTQAYVTITTRIRDPLGAATGDHLTDTAHLSHTTSTTDSNPVETVVGEPNVHIAKHGSVTSDPQTALYTLTLTNDGNAPAYSLIVTDSVPAGVRANNASHGGTVSPDGRTVTWTLDSLSNEPPANTLDLTYTASLSESVYVTTTLTNTAIVRSTSLTDTITGTREYTAETGLPLSWTMGRLGDYVWYDFDYDGVQGSHGSEFPIGGVEIDLFNADTGAYITSTTTDGSGRYIFEHLPLNVTYTVRISTSAYGPGGPLENYTQTRYLVGNPATDSNASITQTFGGQPYAITTTLTPAITEDLSLDYGFVRLVEIGNYVWADDNYDGLQNEPAINGFGGVTVTLTYPDGRVFTTTTNANGYYTFTVPVSMAYTIAVIADNFAPGGPLAVYTYTRINAGSDDALDSDGQPSGGGLVIHTPVITQDNYTFDYGLIRMVALGNLVWFDTGTGGGTPNDGIQNGAESGVPGVTVTLYISGQATPLLTTTTNISGYYQFDNLRPNTYTVHIIAENFQPGGALYGYVSSIGNGDDETTDQNGDENGIDQPALATTGITSTAYALFPGMETTSDDDTGYTGALADDCVNLTADFGFVELVAIGNVVWFDTGAGANYNNGVFDSGESPVAGVTVQLFRQGETTPVLTTTTDASGYYTFDLLIPGTYYVHLPAENFQASGPLYGYVSSVGNGDDETTDDDGDENGIDQPDLATTGISSTLYLLQP
ncbi:MAG TPA: DUF11 domain-containing protein, partial [Anaerolineae bacterium]|nr:DUF11 domain-containing protein [Anaerolineae bacterium]